MIVITITTTIDVVHISVCNAWLLTPEKEMTTMVNNKPHKKKSRKKIVLRQIT